jgi:hypothetical protein
VTFNQYGLGTRTTMLHSEVIRLTVRLAVCVILVAIQKADVSAGSESPESVIETFHVFPDGDALFLPVTIDGQEYSFFVDTGFSCNVVDATLAPALPLLARRERLTGGESQPVRSLRGAFVGKAQLLAGTEAVQLDLSDFRKALGHDIFGILGMPFLRSHILEIDFDRGELSFLKSAPNSAGREFRLFRDRTERAMLSIDITEDDSIAFVIDTGLVGVGAAVNLRNARFDQLYEQGLIELHSSKSKGVTIEGHHQSRRGWLHTLALGDITHRRVGVSEGRESALGLCFLARYIVTFDFPNQRLYLRPGRRVAEPDRLNLSGLGTWRIRTSEVEIASVDPNSPGRAAGLKPGDRILKYDGKSVSTISLFKLRTILATEGTLIKLEVENSAGRREVTLELTAPRNAVAEEETRKP